MINYKLSIYNGEKSYKQLDLTSILDSKKNSCNLEKIDEFTMNFKNEEELKAYLTAKGILPSDSLNKSLKIFYGDKKLRNIPIIYSDSKETMKNISKLSSEIKRYFIHKKNSARSTFSYSQIMDDYRDITQYFDIFQTIARSRGFLTKLQDYCKSNPIQGLNVDDVGIYIGQNYIYTKDKLLYIALFEIYRRLFYTYNKDTKNLEFNYKGFRDYLVYYCDYKKEVLQRREAANKIREEVQQPVSQSKQKVKSKKQEPTSGQYSLFDNINND